ncbi:pilus assembly protein [Xylophilus sp. GOD-11R]|uniref:pilus assembly protein n=1 Tax=Xylophilus sp. GOD-11R TaxID=3089814 RepID=UPI00298C950D|nr:pilus assembly protein [Xylophilus sp. GOD-11R]WPB59303.1 pilus assembly protein [Xylophilus sp. GOD-11R]
MPKSDRRNGERGVALFFVMLLLLLCSISVMGASRVTLLAEMMNGAAVDRAGAFAAAQALLRDAETEIRGAWSDATACRSDDAPSSCRAFGDRVAPPWTNEDYERLVEAVRSDPKLEPCRRGICAPTDPDQLAEFRAHLPALTSPANLVPTFAVHGQYAGTAPSTAGVQANPYLSQNARYWIEVFPYALTVTGGEEAIRFAPDPGRPFVFRITASVQGRRPGTQVLLQEVFVPSPLFGGT